MPYLRHTSKQLTTLFNPLLLLILKQNPDIAKEDALYCASTLHPQIIGVDVFNIVQSEPKNT